MDVYARQVVDGAIVAGPLVRLACKRHLRDRKAKTFIFLEERADHAIDFIETLLFLPGTLDAEGNPAPFVLAPWQKFIVGSLFGWYRPDGYRRFRDAYIEIGKGNGKSPLAAALGLYALLKDNEPAAEVYSAAVTREQAGIVFADAVRMVTSSPHLRTRVKFWGGGEGDVPEKCTGITYAATSSQFRPLSSEHRGLDGKRPHFGILDELHEHPTALVTTKIRAGAKGRRNAMFVEITNSGADRTSICWQHHEHSRKVLQGLVKGDRWFAYVCGLDDGDDPLTTPACWPKANPNLGVSIPVDYLENQVATAKAMPSEANLVLRLNFCVWTQAVSRAFDPAKWAACSALVPDEQLAGVPCYAGLDLGQTDDISALALVFVLEDGRHAVRVHCWMPEGAVARTPDRPYDAWKADGGLTVTQGDMIDMDVVEDAVRGLCERYGVRELAYDKRFAAHLVQHLEGAGITCIDTPQGFQLHEAITTLERLVSEGNLAHGGNPILAWQADNFVTRRGRQGEKRPDKPSAKDKIDAIVALTMALDRVIRRHESISVYETQGITTL